MRVYIYRLFLRVSYHFALEVNRTRLKKFENYRRFDLAEKTSTQKNNFGFVRYVSLRIG